jgi:hypothetical protein
MLVQSRGKESHNKSAILFQIEAKENKRTPGKSRYYRDRGVL